MSFLIITRDKIVIQPWHLSPCVCHWQTCPLPLNKNHIFTSYHTFSLINKTSCADCYSINILNMCLRIQVILMAKIHLCLLFEKKQLIYANKEIYCLMFFLCEGKGCRGLRRQTQWPWHLEKRKKKKKKKKKSPATCSLNTDCSK